MTLTKRSTQAVNAALDLSRRYEASLAELIGDRKLAQLRSILEELYQKIDSLPVAD